MQPASAPLIKSLRMIMVVCGKGDYRVAKFGARVPLALPVFGDPSILLQHWQSQWHIAATIAGFNYESFGLPAADSLG